MWANISNIKTGGAIIPHRKRDNDFAVVRDMIKKTVKNSIKNAKGKSVDFVGITSVHGGGGGGSYGGAIENIMAGIVYGYSNAPVNTTTLVLRQAFIGRGMVYLKDYEASNYIEIHANCIQDPQYWIIQ
jgi:hypothetical protein